MTDRDNTPDVVTLRNARPGDQPTIRKMVRDERLDPSHIYWQSFIVAECRGEIVGIGQVRPYPQCRELGSLIVLEPFRDRGIGGRIIQALLAREPGEVYLECLSFMAPYYARFGFEAIPWQHAPMPLRVKAGLGTVVGRLLGHRMTVMRRPHPHDATQLPAE